MLAAPPRAREQGRHLRLSYRPALDGLRALAVVAVFAYHANLPWARGGFLGVDVFFVLSGYLITALLLAEYQHEGRMDLLRFWGRRARRLLPALVVLLGAVAIAVPLLAPEQAYRLRGDLLAALGYVSNWRLVFENQSYFQAVGRAPLLQHLWSLAVEEQFYLVWPIVLGWALRTKRGTSPTRLVVPLLAASAASALLMALLFQPYSDPSRVYYGTDTRAAALLLGAALACGATRWQSVPRISEVGRAAVETVGMLGLIGLVWTVNQADEFDPQLYRGGFLAVALMATAVVAAGARPGPKGPLTIVLGSRPLVWLGRRSYAVYLWFWPVLVLTRPHRDIDLWGLPLLALRVALTLGLAAASYRLVERPARTGALGRMWRNRGGRRHGGTPWPWPSVAWAAGLTAALFFVGAGIAVSHPPPPLKLNTHAAAGVAARLTAPTLPATTTSAAPTTVTTTAAAVTEPADPVTPTAGPPVATIPVELPKVQARVTAIGDSVLLGAKPLLESQVDGIVVDAAIGRQFPAVLAAARSHRDAGALGPTVLLQTGNNGPIGGDQFDELLELFQGASKVLVVNVKVDRAWQDHNNEVMAEGVTRWPNAVLVDWHSAASANPDAFYDDGLHLTQSGIQLFAGLVLSRL